ncbi:APC family permease [Fictibacillus gelatini]|uniref:APC family permease n=1 Tax=Fictibacillus gelatini TaxID=225985 RepID=UPI0004212B10|nr:APC family permease [Fictibacillus gelatini]
MENGIHLKRSLGLWSIVMLGIGYMSPMALFDTFGIVSEETAGHVPTSYLLALIAMLFTAISYGKMVKAYPMAGSAYTYTQKTINGNLGFLVGWSALLDYLFLPMVAALLTKIYFSAVFPGVPTWVWIVGFVIITTLINIFSINVTANFNTFLVIFQMLVIVTFLILCIKGLLSGEGTGKVLSPEPFFKTGFDFSSVISGATVLCFSFLGFDAVTTLSEETPNAIKTIPRAILLTAFIGGIVFIVVSYFIQSYFPDVTRFKNPEGASPEIALYVGGKLFQSFFIAGTFTSTLATGLASQASVSRLLYVMGRDQMLPKKVFGYIHPKWRTPVINVFLVGGIQLTAIFFDLETASSLINFGALISFTLVNICVIWHYAYYKKQYKSVKEVINFIILPVIGAACIIVLWLNLNMDALVLGISWAIVGFIYLLYLTKMFRTAPPQFNFNEAEAG